MAQVPEMSSPADLKEIPTHVDDTATTILLVAANPASTSRLALDEEVRLIEDELRMATPRAAFRIRAMWAVRPIELLRGLNRERPTIVHFAGHSEMTGIVLVDENEGHVTISGESLARLIVNIPQTVRLVILNACSTDKQSEALLNAVGCVIAMNAPVDDLCARYFSQAFYSAMAEGRSVRRAFDQAVALLTIHRRSDKFREVIPMQAHESPEEAAPVLRHRADVDPDSIYFVAKEMPKSQIAGRQRIWPVAIAGLIVTLTAGFVIAARLQPGLITTNDTAMGSSEYGTRIAEVSDGPAQGAEASFDLEELTPKQRNIPSPVYLVIDEVVLFPTTPGLLIRMTADVNGTKFTYPNKKGVKWLEVGPGMSGQTFRLPFAQEQYRISFDAVTALPAGREAPRIKEKLTSVKEVTIDVATQLPYKGSYVLHALSGMQRGSAARAEVKFRLSHNPN